MAAKKEKKVKTSLPSSSRKKKSPNGFTRTIPEPYLRGTVSIPKIDEAIKNVLEQNSDRATAPERVKFR